MSAARLIFFLQDFGAESGASARFQKLHLSRAGRMRRTHRSGAASDIVQHLVSTNGLFHIPKRMTNEWFQSPRKLIYCACCHPGRSRGFGQLVRARNIKTVGDLSALTPNEIKTLPIHSPKISNVKKALKSYEQQVSGTFFPPCFYPLRAC